MLVLLIAALAMLNRWGAHRERQGYDRAKAEAAIEHDKWLQHEREVDAEVISDYVAKISGLETRVSHLQRRSRPIRLCEPANVPKPDPSGPTSRPEGGSGLRAGRDIGPELWQYAGRCEKLRQQLIAIKSKIDHH